MGYPLLPPPTPTSGNHQSVSVSMSLFSFGGLVCFCFSFFKISQRREIIWQLSFSLRLISLYVTPLLSYLQPMKKNHVAVIPPFQNSLPPIQTPEDSDSWPEKVCSFWSMMCTFCRSGFLFKSSRLLSMSRQPEKITPFNFFLLQKCRKHQLAQVIF